MNETRRGRGEWFLIGSLALVALGLVLAVLVPVAGMALSFWKIEHTTAPTPADLSVGVYASLAVSSVGGLFIVLGLAGTVIALLAGGRGRRSEDA